MLTIFPNANTLFMEVMLTAKFLLNRLILMNVDFGLQKK